MEDLEFESYEEENIDEFVGGIKLNPDQLEFNSNQPFEELIFKAYDVSENVYGEYYIMAFGRHINGTKIALKIQNIPIFFHVLVNGSLLGNDARYYTDGSMSEDASHRIKTILKDAKSHEKALETELKNILISVKEDDIRYEKMKNLCGDFGVSKEVMARYLEGTGLNIEDKEVNDAYSKHTFEDKGSGFKYGTSECHITDEYAYHQQYYETKKVLFKKLTFVGNNAISMRKRAIKTLHNNGIYTANNDDSCYYRKAIREHNLPLNEFMKVNRWEVEGNVWKCDYRDIEPYAYDGKDKAIVMSWDIETATFRPGNPLPEGHEKDDHVFMICCNFYYVNETTPINRYCLVDTDTDPDTRWTTVVCGDEKTLIKTFARLFALYQPDICAGFNDSNYDWKFIIDKATSLGLISYVINTMNYFPIPYNNHLEVFVSTLEKYGLSINQFKEMKRSNQYDVEFTNDDVQVLFNPFWCIDHPIIRDRFEELGRGTMIDKNKFITALRADGIRLSDDTIALLKRSRSFNIDDIFNLKEFKKFILKRVIKVTAEDNFTIEALKVDGCISIDVRCCYKKIYPRSEKSSLNYYLGKEKMDCKFDLPIVLMWRYYKQALINPGTKESTANMRTVANYCIIDAHRCQELMIKKEVYREYAEVSSMARTIFADSYLNAGGIKMRNLLTYEALNRGMFINLKLADFTPKEKYQGAVVLDPIKGIFPKTELMHEIHKFIEKERTMDDIEKFMETNDELFKFSRPIAGLDFSSLYPSIIMAYNLSPEKIIKTWEETQELKLKYPNIKFQKIEFTYGGKLISVYSVRHEDKKDEIGLYPYILIDLFDKRKKLKEKLERYNTASELIKLVHDNGYEYALQECKGDKEKIEILEEYKNYSKEDYEQMKVVSGSIDIKQKAVKIFMNTFYGETGNSVSPFYMVEFAGSVTAMGRYNLLYAKSIVDGEGYLVKYGDTDSLYISPPNKVFAEIDVKFLKGDITLAQWSYELVNISMDVLNKLKNIVNAALKADNGTNRLKMAYEEVIYPGLLTGKKKYLGLKHEKQINFTVTDGKHGNIFKKGVIEDDMRGVSELAKNIASKFMVQCLDINNLETPYNIVVRLIRESMATDYPYEHFKLSMPYKPTKNCITAKSFVKRMEDQGLRVPDDGERFEYVVVKIPRYRANGTNMSISKSDKMCYLDEAKKLGKEIDKEYYFTHGINGFCARFISYLFDADDDKESVMKARKHLDGLIVEDNKEVKVEIKREYKKEVEKITEILGDELCKYVFGDLDYTIWLNDKSKISGKYKITNGDIFTGVIQNYIKNKDSSKFYIFAKLEKIRGKLKEVGNYIDDTITYNVTSETKKEYKFEEYLSYITEYKNILDDLIK